jgi:hypothetical protein
MILAAHQPAYLPWLGYLDKVARSDVFIVVDDVQYEAQNFQNRNRVKINNGVSWLTVPLVHGPQEERVCDKLIAPSPSPREDWRRRAWRTFQIHYGRAPHFKRYAAALEEVYLQPWRSLVDLDLHLLTLTMHWLGIARPVLCSSTMDIRGQKTDRILELCRRVRADTYLSGAGGSMGYLDVKMLEAEGIHVAWQAFRHPVYPQLYPRLGFVPRLGAIDLILNCGPSSRDILLGEERGPDQVIAA